MQQLIYIYSIPVMEIIMEIGQSKPNKNLMEITFLFKSLSKFGKIVGLAPKDIFISLWTLVILQGGVKDLKKQIITLLLACLLLAVKIKNQLIS